MSERRFWFVKATGSSTTSWVVADLRPREAQDDGLPPELYDAAARGDFSALEGPPTFTVSRRKRPVDFLWAEGDPFKVVSARVVEVLRTLGATGWTAKPVEVRHKDGTPLEGYSLLAVTGACDDIYDNIDPATRHEGRAGTLASGVDVTAGWDGSDLFWSRGQASWDFIVTDAVHQALVDADLDGWTSTESTRHELLVG